MGVEAIKSGLNLLIDYLDVCNAAAEEHRHSLVYGPIIAAYDSVFVNRQVGIDIYDGNSDGIETAITIRLVNGKFVPVPAADAHPSFHLKLGRRYMEDVVAHRDEYIQHPEKLDWDWIKSRMGIDLITGLGAPRRCGRGRAGLSNSHLDVEDFMPKTTVGLFEDPGIIENVLHEIEGLGFPRNEVRVLDEPSMFEVTGVMSFGRLDFEVDLKRELTRIGATESETQAYIDGLRRGGALVLATGSDEKAQAAADIMNRYGAIEIEETSGPEPHMPHIVHESAMPKTETAVMAGRIRQPGGGACLFVW